MYRLHLVILNKESKGFLTQSSWVNYFTECSDHIDESLQNLLDFIYFSSREESRAFDVKEKYFTSLMMEYSNRVEVENFLSKLKRSRGLQAGEQMLEKFLSVSTEQQILLDPQARGQRFFENQKLLDDLSDNKVLKTMSELGLSLSLRNYGRAKRKIKKLILFDSYRYLFDLGPALFSEDQKIEEFEEKIVEIIRQSYQQIDDKPLVQMWVYHLSSVFNIEAFNKLKSDLNADWSLSRMRRMLKNHRYGPPFVSFWYDILSGRTTDSELFSFVRQSTLSNHRNLVDMSSYNDWIFLFFYPSDEEFRDVVHRRMNHLLTRKDDLYFNYLMILLSQRSELRDIFASSDNQFKEAYFQLRRSFYLKMLSSGRGIDYAVFNLIKMGEYRDSFLWKYVYFY